MLTIFILYMMTLSGIRVIIETSIPSAIKQIITHFYVARHGAELAKRKIETESNNAQD
jgi:hypothetical protein